MFQCEVSARHAPHVTYSLTLFQVLLLQDVCVCVCVADGVVRVSASSPSVLGAVCFYQLQPLSAYRAVCSLCLYICLLSGCLPIDALVRLSVCRPHLLVCSAAFQPVCLGLLLAGDKRASWQPEAICHSGLFCSAPVGCLLLVCPSLVFVPWDQHVKNYKKRLSLLVDDEAKHTMRTRSLLKDTGADG